MIPREEAEREPDEYEVRIKAIVEKANKTETVLVDRELLVGIRRDYDHPWPDETLGDKVYRERVFNTLSQILGLERLK